MAPTNVGYSFKEAISHFFRNWTTSLGAVITIFLSLFIIGLFIMGSAMLNSVIGTVEDQVVINAFISDDADQADVQAFEAELKTWNNVKSVTYKDKDDALAEYTSKMSGNADATMSALDGQNPLPASFAIEPLFWIVTIKTGIKCMINTIPILTNTSGKYKLILFCIISAQNCCATILICYKIFCCSQVPSKWLSKWTRLSCIPLMKQIKRIPLAKWHAVSKPISFRLII